MTSQLDKPSEWTTGGEAATNKQTAFLKTLADSKGVTDIDPTSLDKSTASQKINELKSMPDDASADTNTTGSNGSVEKPIADPKTWSTGDDSATGKQTGYIAAMAREAGEKIDTSELNKSEASMRIEELKEKTGM